MPFLVQLLLVSNCAGLSVAKHTCVHSGSIIAERTTGMDLFYTRKWGTFWHKGLPEHALKKCMSSNCHARQKQL